MSIEYLNNKVFEELIANFKKSKRYQSRNKERFRKAEEDLANAFYILAANIIKAFNFQLVDKDELLQEGVLICFEKLDHFDPVKGKAFNYYTTCTLNHFRQLYRSAKNYKMFKQKYFDHMCRKFLNKNLTIPPEFLEKDEN
jgi:DNA-directed RNA polymerase specialized sigma subunit